jgi:hypothetical protein
MNTPETSISEKTGGLSTQLGVVLAVAFLLRLAWAALIPVLPVSDGVVYDQFALSIANGQGYAYPDGSLTVFWPVGTSAIYALLYRLFGHDLSVIAGFNVVLGVSIVWLTHRLAIRYFNAPVAVMAAWAIAIWPVLIQFTTVLASELPFIVLLLSALCVWGSARGHWGLRTALWAALLCAASYVRPIAWPLLFLLPTLDWIRHRHLRAALASMALALATAAALFAPWMYRNYTVFGQAVLVSANGGSNTWMGNNPQSTGAYMHMPPTPGMNEVERDRHLGRQAMAFIAEHPREYLRLALRRIGITYSRETIGVAWNETALIAHFGSPVLGAMKIVSSLYWWLILLLGMLGAGRLSARGMRGFMFHPLVVALAYLALIPVLTVGQDRYHIPLDPLLAIFAAYETLTLRRLSPPPMSTATP